jgi:hypothetical protein
VPMPVQHPTARARYRTEKQAKWVVLPSNKFSKSSVILALEGLMMRFLFAHFPLLIAHGACTVSDHGISRLISNCDRALAVPARRETPSEHQPSSAHPAVLMDVMGNTCPGNFA